MVTIVIGWLTLFLFMFNLAVLTKLATERKNCLSLWFITVVSFGAGLFAGGGVLW